MKSAVASAISLCQDGEVIPQSVFTLCTILGEDTEEGLVSLLLIGCNGVVRLGPSLPCTEPGLCTNTRFFQHTQTRHLADHEVPLAEFDKKFIVLESQTAPVIPVMLSSEHQISEQKQVSLRRAALCFHRSSLFPLQLVL